MIPLVNLIVLGLCLPVTAAAADAWKERGGVGDGDVATPPLCGRESQIWRRQGAVGWLGIVTPSVCRFGFS